MAFEFILPDIGEGVVEAEIQRWLVRPGDEVQEDQPLVEVMTDKATVTLPSPRRGRVLRLRYEEGQVAKVHEALLEMELADEAPAQEPARAPPPAEPGAIPLRLAAQEGAEASPPPARPKAIATPAVRAMARQMGIDLQSVPGSGPAGRVTKDDLTRANGHLEARPPAPAAARPRAAPGSEQLPEEPTPPALAHGDEVVPLRGIRRRIAERMAQSKRTAAHFTFVEAVDVSDLVRVKQRIAAAAQDQGVRVTFLPFVVKAVVAALKRHPWLNATLDDARGEIRLRREYHIGVASATEGGLVVPVVRHADRRSLLDLAREIERLSAESKSGKVRPEDMGGSTFTVTSLGAHGGLFATPIINYPEVGILGVHRIRPTPVVKDGQIVARDVMHVSLSFDHRVVDGHVGAAFAYAVVGYLEDPNLLFMEMV